MKNIFYLIVFITSLSFSQGDASLGRDYPTDYFRKPLDIPIYLSGTFGELRGNHFHAGLDIKTQQREGIKIYTAAEGYVSRIKISHWGYGKAIYITHPNGYTTVYAHLKKFNKRIEAYIKKQQYKKESFEIQLFPSAATLPISKDEMIAYSGSTGGFVGPHLHFEIRDTKTEKPINPMFFGITVNDSKKPRINTLIGYPLSNNSHINKLGDKHQISLYKAKNGDLISKKINAHGPISFGINAYDQLDGAYNKNGLYSLKMLVNGKKIHEFNANSFSFYESRYINLLIDYERYSTLKQRIQKCYIEPLNKLSMYKPNSKGIINVKDSLTYNVEIIAKDFKGNTQKVKIPIVGKKNVDIVKKEEKITPYKINYKEYKKITKNGVTVAFPSYSFFQDFYLDFKVEDSIAFIHKPIYPLHKKFTVTFNVSKYSEEAKKKMYIAYFDSKNKSSFEPTTKEGDIFYTSTRSLGKYGLLSDTKNPIVVPNNFKNEQWLTNFKTLKVKIADNESGIKSYRSEIDGQWILMEYNVKLGLLTYNLSDRKFETAKHNLKLVVTDNVGNTTTINRTFYRKK